MPQLDAISNVETPIHSADQAKTCRTRRGRIMLIDDDAAFAESLAENLADEGFRVLTFTDGRSAVTSLCGGESAEIILLDWHMPGMNGLEILREIRQSGITTPVIFLTALSDEIHEEAALIGGAVDFIDKSRRFAILVKRIELSAEGQGSRPDVREPQADQLRLGVLELRFDMSRAFWREQAIGLTLTEFRILSFLVRKAGEDASYREIYDLVHGKDFVAGKGATGYHANVRTFIKRIRRKFYAIDPEFDHIQNYARFGYRWVAKPRKAGDAAGSPGASERVQTSHPN